VDLSESAFLFLLPTIEKYKLNHKVIRNRTINPSKREEQICDFLRYLIEQGYISQLNERYVASSEFRKDNKVEKIVEELLEGTNIELVAVEYVREKDWYLRVFIDKEGGIELDDCQELSGRLGDILDEKDVIKGAYMLEVSSPGLDRELKKEKDFRREQGKKVDVSLYAAVDGSKVLVGVLNGYDGDNVTIDEQVIPMDNVAQVRLHIDF
jgi:ribosome maturation factor RimP